MVAGGYRKSIAFFIVFGACLVAIAVGLNIGWILLNWRESLLLFLGVLLFLVIITGMVLNTVFLVREIRRNEQHDNFINAVTHELKTPVASIRLYLETLQRHDLDEARRREFYAIMLGDSDRLLQTIEQVLRAGKSKSFLHKGQVTSVDMRLLVSDCVALTRLRYNLKPAQVRFQDEFPQDAPVTVRGDAEELRSAVMNLLENAVKYSGDSINVELRLRPLDAGMLAVQVMDQGIGLAPAELKRVFKRFYRVPGTLGARVKGTGLGLFIVKAVARRHGGRAWAASPGVGHGSRFTIELPLS